LGFNLTVEGPQKRFRHKGGRKYKREQTKQRKRGDYMNIAKELYSSGLLSHNRTQHTSSYEIASVHKPRWRSKEQHPFMEAFQRSEPSTKVSEQGWRTLSDALR